MNNNFLIPAILFLLCLILRAVYELLKEARKINPESKPIFAVILSVMVILWLSWFSLCLSDPIRLEFPETIRWIGLAVFVLGTILAVGALVQLRGVENIDHLVTAGLFKKLRHPMYYGFIFWLVGWSVYHSGLISLVIGLAGILCVLWWRRLEEQRLVVQFGSSFEQYRQTTWF